MNARTLRFAAAGLGCLGLLLLVSGGALLAGGVLRGAGSGLLRGAGGAPTESDIEGAIRRTWESPGDGTAARSTVEVHSIEIGDTEPANDQDVVYGIPPDADVTLALVDWTVRDHYATDITIVRRRREHKVYLDGFGQWKAMMGARHGDDQTTHEQP